MLMLSLELRLGVGRTQLPPHLGGVLHGFFEGGVKNHAPHLLPVLRPNGPHEAAHFMILPPPVEQAIENFLHFAVILYGNAAKAWPMLLRALLEQQSNGLHGHSMQIVQAWCAHPAGEAYPLLEDGHLVERPGELPAQRCMDAIAHQFLADSNPTFYQLSFRSPLLLASRKAQRERNRIAVGLPWPSLGALLDSIADRLRTFEPALAEELGLDPRWSAPAFAREIEPMTLAANPAQQLEWDYTSTPRREEGLPPASRRTVPIFGIVGDLIYPATGIDHEPALLYWGQWLGVGQKTTMGCGNYALIA